MIVHPRVGDHLIIHDQFLANLPQKFEPWSRFTNRKISAKDQRAKPLTHLLAAFDQNPGTGA